MDGRCREFRDRWLERALDAPADRPDSPEVHAGDCAACGAWLRSVRAQVGLLGALPRLRLPKDFDGVIEAGMARAPDELAAAEARYETLWRALPRVEAPDALARRVEAELVDRPRPTAVERALFAIGEAGSTGVPSVLDRLVEEELAAPAAHRAERWVGNLERLRAPEELAERVRRVLRRRRVPLLAGLGSLAAAVLVVWLAAVRTPDVTAPTRRLRVVHVDQGELSPVARGLAEALNGGWASASEPGGERR